jgi:hypothetical protein
MAQADGRNPKLNARVDPDIAERCQRVADQLYDGNMALFVRLAIKRFLTDQEELAQQLAAREAVVREPVAA